MKKPKYKPNDYIVVTGSSDNKFVGTTVKVVSIEHGEVYLIDTLHEDVNYYPAWSIDKCDSNSELNVAMTLLYSNRS